MAPRRRWVWLCLLLFAAAALRLAGWQGWFRPVRISGGSMADALLGEHHRQPCSECGFPSRYDATAPPGDGRVACPNCGSIFDHQLDAAVFPGQRVWIDRLAYRWRSPRRWDVIAFRKADRLEVKRVVGLPGENVQIRGGDLFVDGRRVRKSLAELRQVALLVHDNDYRPRAASTDWRWRPEDVENSPWRAVEEQLRFYPQPADQAEWAWIAYHHRPGFAGRRAAEVNSPILDDYGYNQNVSRQLQPVEDVMLDCRLTVADRGGGVRLEMAAWGEVFQVTLDCERRVGELLAGSRAISFELPAAALARGVKIELAACDRRVMFAVEEQLLAWTDYAPDGSPPASTKTSSSGRPRFRIGARGPAVTVERLRVWRDIHYLDPNALPLPWNGPERLGPTELLVLGDNVPVAEDSRLWARPALAQSSVLGRVVPMCPLATRQP